jgi:hypothetical protein
VLIVPLLVWTAMMWPRLPAGAGGAEAVPAWLELAEQVCRVGVFAGPLLLTLDYRGRRGATGLVAYGIGFALYALTWVPWLAGRELGNLTWTLGPAVAPLAVFAAIAALGRSWRYLMVAVGFTIVHTAHVAVRAGVLS